MEERAIRLAISGYGVRGRQWARCIAAAPGAVLAAVADVSEQARAHAIAPTFSSLSGALDRAAADAVIVATPPQQHVPDVLAALERGLPVLCEKPLTEGLEEALGLVAAARRAGVPLLVGMNFRFVPATQEYRRIVRSGDLGEALYGHFAYVRNRDGRRPDLNDFPLTMAQPMLFEQSIHHFDLLRYVYDREVVAISADTWNPPTSVYRDDSCVAAFLHFQGGLRVAYLGTWTSGSNRVDFRWRTDFADGVVVQVDQFGTLLTSRRDPRAGLTGPLFDAEAEPLRDLGVPTGEPFIADTSRLLARFLAVVRVGEAPEPSAEDHLYTMLLLLAARAAATEGRRIDMRAFAADHGIPMPGARSGQMC
jgi:predicted dehydrogenase